MFCACLELYNALLISMVVVYTWQHPMCLKKEWHPPVFFLTGIIPVTTGIKKNWSVTGKKKWLEFGAKRQKSVTGIWLEFWREAPRKNDWKTTKWLDFRQKILIRNKISLFARQKTIEMSYWRTSFSKFSPAARKYHRKTWFWKLFYEKKSNWNIWLEYGAKRRKKSDWNKQNLKKKHWPLQRLFT